MRSWNVPIIAAVALLVACAEAHAADSRIVLRGGAGWISSSGEWTGDLLLTEGLSVTNLEADSTTGPQLNLEYIFTHLIGGEVSVLQGSQDLKGSGLRFPRATFGQVTERPILLGVNFHVTRNRTIDLYLGPVIGWVMWGDLAPSAAARQEVTIGAIRMQDTLAWGVNTGVDVPFAKHWAFNFDLRRLDYSARTDSRPVKTVLGEDLKIPIKPLIGSAGLALRW
jgi:outer membrane protein W